MTEKTPDAVYRFRWLVLALVGFVVLCTYYAYSSLTPIADVMMRDLGITRAQYGLFYSYASIPNLVMVLLGGLLVDRIGVRKAGLLFSALSCIGVTLTAAGPTLGLMLAGRLVAGIGAESMIVAVNATLAKWFRGRELALALGLEIAMVRLGNLASLNLGVYAFERTGSWRAALWLAAVLVLSSFVVYVVFGRLDKATERHFEAGGLAPQADAFRIRDLVQFSPSFWYITLLCVTFYSVVYPFMAFSVVFFQKKYGMTAVQGSAYGSLIFLSTMVLTPLFGLMVDRIGKRATVLMLGSVALIPVFLTLGLTSLPPLVPMLVLGVSDSVVPAALWSAIPLVVNQTRLGTAYGVVTLVQNAGLTVVPWVAGKVADLSGGDYRNTMLLFSLMGLVAMVLTIALKASDRRDGRSVLELPTRLAQAALANMTKT
jgi:MFS family permease